MSNFINNLAFPSQADSLEQLEKLIALLLGCAVQCINGHFCEQINTLDLAQRQTLVEYGWKIMNTTSYVKPIDWSHLEEIPKQ